MTFNLVKIWHEMGFASKAIAGTLLLMAVAALAVFVERLLAFRRQRREALSFGRLAQQLIDRRDFEALYKHAEEQGSNALAAVVRDGLRVYLAAQRRPGSVPAIELVRRELARKREGQEQEVRRGLSVLATVGSIAPFVGLLGTVVGIISAFTGIAKEGSGGLGAVSSGIAEALIETAFGLVVAIPTVMGFNYLSGAADRILTALDEARGEFVDAVESGEGAILVSSPRAGAKVEVVSAA